jgi:hypothetical protein
VKSKRRFYVWECFGHTFGKDAIVRRVGVFESEVEDIKKREKTRENGRMLSGQSSTNGCFDFFWDPDGICS